MRKTTQTVEIEVEGPNADGRYRVDSSSVWWRPADHPDPMWRAINQHIASAPKVEEFEGFLIGPFGSHPGSLGVWPLENRDYAEKGTACWVAAKSAEDAWDRVHNYSERGGSRMYVPAALALAHWFEKEAKNA